MIRTAEEFMVLRQSDDPALYRRAAQEPAPDSVWMEVIEKWPNMKIWVVHNKTVPSHILAILSSDSDRNVRLAVAMTRRTNPSILETLADDPDFAVRMRVACNAKAPLSALAKLANDPSEQIADVARKRMLAKRTPG